jgi:hypothetical protein
LAVEGSDAISAWDERGTPLIIVPDTRKAKQEIDSLAKKDSGCVAELYEASFVVGVPKRYRSPQGAWVTLVPLLNVPEANLTDRPEAELHALLHKADLSASRICRKGRDLKPWPMIDAYITGSRLQNG